MGRAEERRRINAERKLAKRGNKHIAITPGNTFKVAWELYVQVLCIMAYVLYQRGSGSDEILSVLDDIQKLMVDGVSVKMIKEYMRSSAGMDLDEKYLF